MKTYRLDPAKLPRQRRNIILLYLISGALMVALTFYINRNQQTMSSVVWLIPLIFLLFGYSGYRALEMRKQFWQDYALTLDENGVTQEQPNTPDLRFRRQDLTAVKENRFGLLLSIRQARNILSISHDLKEMDYLEVKTTLERWLAENQAAAPQVTETPSQPKVQP